MSPACYMLSLTYFEKEKMDNIKYAVHIMEFGDGDTSVFERGQSYGLFDTIEIAESFLEGNFTDVDAHIYPMKIVKWD